MSSVEGAHIPKSCMILHKGHLTWIVHTILTLSCKDIRNVSESVLSWLVKR